MENGKSDRIKPKTKEQIHQEKRAEYIKNSSDQYLHQLYRVYLELNKIIASICRSYTNQSVSVQLMKDEVIKWIATAEKLVRGIYYEKSPQDYELFMIYCTEIPVHKILPWHSITDNFVGEYVGSLQAVCAHINGMIDNYILFEKHLPQRTKISALDLVLDICKNFPRVVKQLSRRHDKREPFTIKDEYDVQDLLHALLSVHFADIRDEESCPSCAGLNSRIDFFLKEEKIGIEVKMISQNLTDKKLLPQLTEDLKQYQTNPGIKTLVIFIYDPDQSLKNPQAFINDLSGKEGDMEVKVVISPL